MTQQQTDNTSVYIYVGVTLVLITVLTVFLVLCEKKKNTCSTYTGPSYSNTLPCSPSPSHPTVDRNLCLCTGMGGKVCANREELQKTYLEGNNEYQLLIRPPTAWKNTDFSLY